ncbi:uncharacterized protein LOC127880805 [Dreissena polymorpha]|uniref:Uncharacterized protein n=1 Tax=Dreissena polymorpha TaxID=45954 RepID=A0A9D4H5M3_DREPO|nr:uncharacterized protein LOC127880805 [Dreissena polymorpha]KAH3829013.1 hypothetical protein DPMN_131001 [Dreissena polymorpha]
MFHTRTSIWPWTFIILLIVSGSFAQETGRSSGSSMPELSPDEKYQDIFPLTKENFTESVLGSKDAWIVLFHEGSVNITWKAMAAKSRGLFWIGAVDRKTEHKLVDSLGYDPEQGVARLYPYGGKSTKTKHWKSFENETNARDAAITSLPDTVMTFQTENLNDILLECFMARPSKFPVFILQDATNIYPYIRALAIRFEKYFTFVKVVKPTADDLKAIGLPEAPRSLPELFIITTKEKMINAFNAVRFDTDKFGVSSYTNIMEFLFAINNQYRHELPGDNRGSSQQEAEMADVVAIETKRFDIIFPTMSTSGRSKSSSSEPKDEL